MEYKLKALHTNLERSLKKGSAANEILLLVDKLCFKYQQIYQDSLTQKLKHTILGSNLQKSVKLNYLINDNFPRKFFGSSGQFHLQDWNLYAMARQAFFKSLSSP